MGRKRLFANRYLILAILFVVICALYGARLVYLQVINPDAYISPYPEGSVTRKVTVVAQRGEIYDCNGVLLVGNAYSYSVLIDGNALPDRADERNDLLLSLLDATADLPQRTNTFFPFEGEYPNLSYTAEAQTPETDGAKTLQKLLSALSLPSDASADTLIETVIAKYKIASSYSPKEITSLLRLRLNTLLASFSVSNPYPLISGADLETVIALRERGLRGVLYRTDAVRTYPCGSYASHILGRVGPIFAENQEKYTALGYAISDTVGIGGAEEAFESILRGKNGEVVLVEDADGVLLDSYYTVEPVAGRDVYLTIDIRLQIAAEDALADAVSTVRTEFGKQECNAGASVTLNPADGSVLAIASYPSYSLATFSQDYAALSASVSAPLTNRALFGLYAPGSTYKLSVAAAALTEGILSEKTAIECEGVYGYYEDYRPRCWIYTSGGSYAGNVGCHGVLTVKQALAESCNCFFYEVGRLTGIDTMNAYAKLFGLGEPTGIELGEAVGSRAGEAVASFTAGDTLSAAIGQSGNAFTPTQLASYLATLANGGTRYAVHLLKEVKTFEGESVSVTGAEVLSAVPLSPQTHALLLDAMKEMVETHAFVSFQMRNLPVSVGGKTGTAQVTSGDETGLFFAVAPTENPEIVTVSLLEHASSGTYASMIAGRILEAFYNPKIGN